MSFLDGLNDEQREAVKTTEGPLLVLAGAGSGKTRVLTHRIAYILEQKDIFPDNILAITFTNKAAKEMKERIQRLVDIRVEDMWVGTFHSMCVRMLRRDIDKIDYNRNFVIFDGSDQNTVIKDTIKELNVNEKMYEPKKMIHFISSLKDKLIDPDTYINDNYSDFRERQKGEIYRLYQEKLQKNNALDFDDLIGKTIELFRNNPDILKFYQKKFKYILVDEYQDTNRAQYELVKLLGNAHKNVCVVGDDDQSIYGWRGADIRNILDFEEDYPNAKTIKLEQNYRSTKNILDAANKVIDNNMGRKGKNLWTSQNEGTNIGLYNGDNEHDEAKFIASKIKEIKNTDHKNYSDFAILYRTNAQSRVLEESLVKSNIPYKIVGGLKFYDRKEIKDIIAFLRLIQNPVDNISLKRIINVPKRGIGKRTVEKIEQLSIEKGESIYSVILDIDEMTSLSHRAKSKVKDFVSIINKFIAMKEILSVKDLIENVIESTGYIKELQKEDTLEAQSRIENIEEFISVAIDFENTSEENTLEEFLANISLLSDIDRLDEDDDFVTLMTLHSAKGLEYDIVFLTGMEEGIFPISRAMVSEDDLEEERRLCYVGITRAKEHLFITYTTLRTIYGKTNYNSISRFIDEIPDSLIDNINDKAKKKAKISQQKNNKYFTGYTHENTGIKRKNDPNINIGDKVKHKTLGLGTVVGIKGSGDKKEATIAFNEKGIKKLLISLAPIEKV